MATIPPQRGDILTECQLDDAVHAVQLQALSLGMIPIAGIMSRRRPDGTHEVLGCGWNHLREGIPGIHGETGAIMDMGRLDGGYADVVATSSLNPCPFCQRALARHLGVREVRILDAENYVPDLTSYPPSLKPVISHHRHTADTFKEWVADPANATIWSRDIGLYPGPVPPVFNLAANPTRTAQLAALAHHQANLAVESNEAPIGALIVDAQGEVIGAGHSSIVSHDDPSRVAAMAAWRAAGARDQWKDKTLVLTAGPDHIAFSMFKVFNFGQLLVTSAAVFQGQLNPLRDLGTPTTLLNDQEADEPLRMWLARSPAALAREYLGADWLPPTHASTPL
jgi:tRNA(Arg) A34 adenosine deaminase TadA